MKDKKIIVGVTGGIAAYRAAELVRLLVKAGAQAKVVMTRSATRFVTPMTFEALSGNRVIWDMFEQETAAMEHIRWGQDSDLIIIAPATANFISKMAHGIGDDFLSTMILAATAPILVCPSMNSHMFLNPVVQDNIRLLRDRGYGVMDPVVGGLACKAEGPGRLPEPGDIVERARIFISKKDLSDLRILITAGATVEPIDPVRYITNRSSGKMGYALARAARRRGADVILISGPTSQVPPLDVVLCPVKTAEEMKKAVLEHYPQCHVVIKAAAVLDYRPRERVAQKIKKRDDILTLEFVKNPDILAELGALKGDSRCLLVGFAAETEDLMVNAKEKLRQKNLDVIVANDVSREDAGFESDTNLVKIIFRDGRIEDLPLMMKEEVADHILDRVKALWDTR
ncbi:MAG: bifunctional phosphopantothenoylcysteine decarboxylase/phosphopantothenate--cysteine ligase CoaBC [Pseudomonadota bacterium]